MYIRITKEYNITFVINEFVKLQMFLYISRIQLWLFMHAYIRICDLA